MCLCRLSFKFIARSYIYFYKSDTERNERCECSRADSTIKRRNRGIQTQQGADSMSAGRLYTLEFMSKEGRRELRRFTSLFAQLNLITRNKLSFFILLAKLII